MNTVSILQSKVAKLPEPIAAEVLDFLEFVAARRSSESKQQSASIDQFRGSFKGRLSSSNEYAARKSDEIHLKG
jgi:uncharacterized protein YfbU (UPF0304 family)